MLALEAVPRQAAGTTVVVDPAAVVDVMADAEVEVGGLVVVVVVGGGDDGWQAARPSPSPATMPAASVVDRRLRRGM